MWIDTHCHLNFDYDSKTTEDLVNEAILAKVDYLIAISTEVSNFSEVQSISEKFTNVFHTIGVHPHDSVDIKDSDLKTIEQLARHPKCVAIGEIGLDYYYDNSPREIQKKRLKQHLDLAIKLNLPVVIHSRDAEEDLYPLLKEYANHSSLKNRCGVIHCFSGTKEFGQKCLDLGFYISFSGILTFKNANELREAAQSYPIERILVETDSPFLAPIPFRGKKCEPKMVVETGMKLAEIKAMTAEKIAQITTKNAKALFNFN
ncbi:MAG: hypothetical protein CL678_08975 [Bdellovibrionaceae bacterium]|nr:hypothetical protein [Pseudobdellovibrionaceae bacterium]|tara:strand:+ start:3770 stop:4549 length:780 start_codon:yes stop_codon:yes gene_type:complete